MIVNRECNSESKSDVLEKQLFFLQGCMLVHGTEGEIRKLNQLKCDGGSDGEQKSCVYPGYLGKPPDNIYCSALQL